MYSLHNSPNCCSAFGKKEAPPGRALTPLHPVAPLLRKGAAGPASDWLPAPPSECRQMASSDQGGAGHGKPGKAIWRPRRTILAACPRAGGPPLLFPPRGRPHGGVTGEPCEWFPSQPQAKNQLQRRPQRADLPAQYAALAAFSKDNRRENTPETPVLQGFVNKVSHLGDENISSGR